MGGGGGHALNTPVLFGSSWSMDVRNQDFAKLFAHLALSCLLIRFECLLPSQFVELFLGIIVRRDFYLH